jgi:GNAT superfamily N-acetyltransferase
MDILQIRRARDEDADAILTCLAAAFETYHRQYTPEAFAATVLDKDTIHLRLRELCVLVAVSEREVVGTIGYSVRGTEGHLRGMAVLPGRQGTGVASKLLQTAEAQLLARGCNRATLATTGPLQRAIRFYECHGYALSGRISDFFGMKLYEYAKPLSSAGRWRHAHPDGRARSLWMGIYPVIRVLAGSVARTIGGNTSWCVRAST